MFKAINLFINKETEDNKLINKNQETIIKELNLTELHKTIEERGSEIIFNFNQEINIKLKCKHVERNRRDKIVWYGEGENRSFAMIVVNHINDKEFSFYGEIVEIDNQYLINSVDYTNNVVITYNKRTTRGKCETCKSFKPSLGIKDTATIIGKENTEKDINYSTTSIAAIEAAWEPFDSSKVKEEMVELKILAVYNKKTKEEVEQLAKGKPYVGGKQTGKEIIEYLAQVAEDTTNIIFKNSNINTKVHVILEEVDLDLLYGERVTQALGEILNNNNASKLKPLYDLREQHKAPIVSIFIPKATYEQNGHSITAGVGAYIVTNINQSLSTIGNDLFVLSLFIAPQGSIIKNDTNVSLSAPIFAHELGHLMGGFHPYPIGGGGFDHYLSYNNVWMRGCSIFSHKSTNWIITKTGEFYKEYTQHQTVMGYNNMIPYFSSPNNIEAEHTYKQPIGISVGELGESDVSRGFRISSKWISKRYSSAKLMTMPAVKIEPSSQELPTAGRVLEDPIAANKLRLTAIPFNNRSTFSHWEVDDKEVEKGKLDIIINTNTQHNISAHFKQDMQKHKVTFTSTINNLNYQGNIYFEAGGEIKSKAVSKLPYTIENVLHGTDIEFNIYPDNNGRDIAWFAYELDGKIMDYSSFKAFRVTKDCTVKIIVLQLSFFIERADLGIIHVSKNIIDSKEAYIVNIYNENISQLDKFTINNEPYNNTILTFSNLVNFLKDHNKLHNGIINITVTFKEKEHHSNTTTLYSVTLKTNPEQIGTMELAKIGSINDGEMPLMEEKMVNATVKQGAQVQANIRLSKEETEQKYILKGWEHNNSKTNVALYTIDKDTVITANLIKFGSFVQYDENSMWSTKPENTELMQYVLQGEKFINLIKLQALDKNNKPVQIKDKEVYCFIYNNSNADSSNYLMAYKLLLNEEGKIISVPKTNKIKEDCTIRITIQFPENKYASINFYGQVLSPKIEHKVSTIEVGNNNLEAKTSQSLPNFQGFVVKDGNVVIEAVAVDLHLYHVNQDKQITTINDKEPYFMVAGEKVTSYRAISGLVHGKVIIPPVVAGSETGKYYIKATVNAKQIKSNLKEVIAKCNFEIKI